MHQHLLSFGRFLRAVDMERATPNMTISQSLPLAMQRSSRSKTLVIGLVVGLTVLFIVLVAITLIIIFPR
jgi:hypothetical protein